MNAENTNHGRRREVIVEAIMADIVRGKYESSARLITSELASRFGVSATPIREALAELAGIGVVDLVPNKGAVVRNLSERDVRNICHVRKALECEAIRLACGRIPKRLLMAIRDEIVVISEEGADAADFIPRACDIDSRLHAMISRYADNSFLTREIDRFTTLFRSLRDAAWLDDGALNDEARIEEEAEQHLEIVNALIAKDRKAAKRAMAKHLRTSIRYWGKSLPGS